MLGSVLWNPFNFTLVNTFKSMCLGQMLFPLLCPYPHDKRGVSDLVFKRQFYYQKICFHSKWIPSSIPSLTVDYSLHPWVWTQQLWWWLTQMLPKSLAFLALHGSYHWSFQLFDTRNISWIFSCTPLVPGMLYCVFSILNYAEVRKAAFLMQLWAGAVEGVQGCGHPACQAGS